LTRILFAVIVLVSVFPACTDPRVGMLVDQAEIIRTINTLFIETDKRNWDAVRNVLADTVLFDMTSMTGGEPLRRTSQNIVDMWDAGLKSLQAIHHQTGDYDITINGSEADAFCYGIASHYLPNATGQNTRTFVGSYDFHLIRNGHSWLIDRFKFNLKYVDGNRDLTGSVQ
jgi:hypothetical protein